MQVTFSSNMKIQRYRNYLSREYSEIVFWRSETIIILNLDKKS